MAHETHPNHTHVHGADCGHVRVQHDDHHDFLHDGHLHSVHDDHVDEHVLPAGEASACGTHACSEHDASHVHGGSCGHEAVPHGDHSDYLVGSHLHHQHESHCDDHGAVALA